MIFRFSVFIYHFYLAKVLQFFLSQINHHLCSMPLQQIRKEAELSMLTVAAASGWKGGGEMGGESNREGVRHRDVAALGTAVAASEDSSLTTQMECERTLPMATAHKSHDQREDM